MRKRLSADRASFIEPYLIPSRQAPVCTENQFLQ